MDVYNLNILYQDLLLHQNHLFLQQQMSVLYDIHIVVDYCQLYKIQLQLVDIHHLHHLHLLLHLHHHHKQCQQHQYSVLHYYLIQ